MSSTNPAGDVDLEKLIAEVGRYGEQARLLALNLAVATKKFSPRGSAGRKLNDDLFSLVTRMTTVARQVAEITTVAEKGFDRSRLDETDRLLRLLLEKGVFSAEVIAHLERSLVELVSLAQQVAESVGLQLPESCPHKSV